MILIHCLIAIIATAGWVKFIYYAIQPGQIFGFYTNWLLRLDLKGWKIVKPLGLCEMCFSIFCAFCSYAMAATILLWGEKWEWWLIMYFAYVPISALANIKVLKRQ